MSKKDIFKLLTINTYINNKNYNCFYETIHDEKVNDCILMLYFCMISDKKEESDKFYIDFKEKYNKLNVKQQEIIKNELAKILNIEYKPMIKKKER